MRWSLSLFISVLAVSANAADRISEQTVSIQLLESVDVITIFSPVGFTLKDAENDFSFSAGLYELSRQTTTPPEQQFHLFSKTFPLDQPDAESDYVQSWIDRGYPAKSLTIGKELTTERGRTLDARIHWISIDQAPTLEEAKRKQKQLEATEQWTWMRSEIVSPGTGTVKLQGPQGAYSLTLPITIDSAKAISVANVNVGFWNEDLKHLAYRGTLELTLSPLGGLELLEHSPVEEYLRGVLPSEMPAQWPEEALKAQAVSARSEVLVNLSTKHSLERFDFCNKEHCRAYQGINRHAPQTDAALQETLGRILVQNDMIVPTVFSANCGGWTANNDTVWSAPVNNALRAISDTPKPVAHSLQTTTALRAWLNKSSTAFCRSDPKGFRWTRNFSETELRAMMEKRGTIGRFQKIELGERGESGRLKWIRIHGSSGSEVIKKELPIRRAFGGLFSAMVDLTVTGTAPNRSYQFTGGGRGHGVGLCQNGARGMAEAGHDYKQILHHYFTDVSIEKVR